MCLNTGFVCNLLHSIQKTILSYCLFACLQQCLSYLHRRSIIQISIFIPVLHLNAYITTYQRLSLRSGLTLPQMRDCHSHQLLCSLQTVKQYWSHALADTSFLGTGDGPFSQEVSRAVWALGDTQSRGKHHAPSHKVLCCKSGALVLSRALCASVFLTTKWGSAMNTSVYKTCSTRICVYVTLHTAEGPVLTSNTEVVLM